MVPNGFVMPEWTPEATGHDWVAPTIAKPLEPIRKKIMILTGLDHQKTSSPGTPPGDHGAGTGCFLNMIPVNGHENDKTRTSLDQALLPILNSAECGTPKLASLQLGIQGDNGLCDRTSCNFSRVLSWSKGTPMPNIYDPQQCFDRLFAGSSGMASSKDAAQRVAERKSVLDRVLAQALSLQGKLGKSDSQKLEEYLTSVRELEQRIARLSAGGGAMTCEAPARPDKSPPLNQERGITPSTIIEKHVPIFVDLMALAFQCDLTRAITFMLGNGTSNNDYNFLIGSSTPHHGTSHHTNDKARLAKLTKIGAWEVGQAAALLTKLDGVMEADGKSVLDHTTFYLSSDIGDGNAHNHWDMPVLVAGGASGKLKIDGRHVSYTPKMTFPRPLVGPRSETHTGRVFISMLNAHGMMQSTFGEATGGPLPELMA
jgi:hypothetical protein